MGGSFNLSNSSIPLPANASLIPAISLSQDTGNRLLDAATGGQLLASIRLVHMAALDPSAVILWLLAVSTVIGGSIWSGVDYAATKRRGRGGHVGAESHVHQQEVLDLTAGGAVGFVIMASLMLLLLFFFMNHVFFIIIVVMFSLAGVQSMVAWMAPLLQSCGPKWLHGSTVDIPYVDEVSLAALLVTPVAAGIAVVWAVSRNTSWSWVLQDIIGISLMLLVMRTLRLGSMRVACILLPLCFAYDVFWVFVQPLLFGDGTSVMVEVAQGGDSHEYLPMLLRVPWLSGPSILRGYSLLGFGDVILPGILVALTKRMDIDSSARWHSGYFLPAVLGYSFGLILTYAALLFSWFGDQGQPALLYLVPCTLGLILLLGWWRGDLGRMFSDTKTWGALTGDSAAGDNHDGDHAEYSASVLAASAALEDPEDLRPSTDAGVPEYDRNASISIMERASLLPKLHR